MNASLLALVNGSFVPQGFSMTFDELICDWCSQLDSMIGLMVVFLLSFYVFRNIIVPLGVKGMLSALPVGFDMIFKPLVLRVSGYIDSFLETAALFSALFLFYVCYEQGLISRLGIAWVTFLGVCVTLSLIARGMVWFRNKKVGKGLNGDLND